MRKLKVAAAFMAIALFVASTGCSKAKTEAAKEDIEDTFKSYMKNVKAGKDASKYVDAKKEAEPQITADQHFLLLGLLNYSDYEITETEVDLKEKEGTVTIEFNYIDVESIAEDYFADETDDILKAIADTPEDEKLSKKIKFDLVLDDGDWLISKKSDSKFKKFLAGLVDDIYLEGKSVIIDDAPETVMVGISLPTEYLMRWENDGNLMKQQLDSLGYKVELQYADNSVNTQIAQIGNMIDSGCKVIIIAAIDSFSLDNVLVQAAGKGVKIIAYDRLIAGTQDADYYVSFDNYLTGVSQAQYIIDKLKLDSAPAGKTFNIEFTAGDPDDVNGQMFYNGAYDTLAPYIASGVVIVPSGQYQFKDVTTDAWMTDMARGRAESIIGKYYSSGANIDAWICSNDSTALGVAEALAALETVYKGTYPLITGQDCDIANVKNIINGKQAMSIFKDTSVIASRAVTMADQILSGKTVECNDTPTAGDSAKKIPSYLCAPVVVDVSNYKKILIDSGYYTADDLI